MYMTGDETSTVPPTRIRSPVAQAVFFRGQQPVRAAVGAIVENDLDGALRAIEQGWAPATGLSQRWALVLLDLCFYTGPVTTVSDQRARGTPEGRTADSRPDLYFGLQLLTAVSARFPDLPVVVFSSKPRKPVNRLYTNRGALAFLPRDATMGAETLRSLIWRHGLIADETGEVVGRSLGLLLALRQARRAAADRRNLLIQGERGTGKELLARYANRQAKRDHGSRPFVEVDCGAINPHLYGSELFGHVRGAFTGADRDRIGLIEQADGGDLFLDEVGNLPGAIQAALLRVLHPPHVVIPVGANAGRPMDIRILSATNDDLPSRSTFADFRADLLDRLRAGGTIHLSPLRDRAEDVPLLTERLLRAAEERHTGAVYRHIEPETLAVLLRHDWPGNIRELRHCLERAVANFPDAEYLAPLHLQLPSTARRAAPAPLAPAETAGPERTAAAHVTDIVNQLDALEVAPLRAYLRGAFPEIQAACGRLLARLLRAALEATNDPLTDYTPGQNYPILAAVRLLSGDKSIPGPAAADFVKRIVRWVGDGPVFTDPLLAAALRTALEYRPRPSRDGADSALTNLDERKS